MHPQFVNRSNKGLMRAIILQAAAVWLALVGTSALATVRYVDVNNAAPAPPYTTWASAARTIQQAIDVALAGDEIVVTNGVYQTGGRAVDGAMTNRVAVTKPLTVRSVNGPGVTVIAGQQVSATVAGDSAVRCVYLTNGAALTGFTLTNGVADYGGGVWCASASAVVSNCVLSGNSATYNGGGANGGTLYNCTLSGNSVNFADPDCPGTGGGAFGGSLNNCTLTGNSAPNGDGGGAAECTLNNCTLTGNSAYAAGGAAGGILNNCTLNSNSAVFGGGAWGTLNNCTLTGNSADSGGGAFYSALNNCIVYYNLARQGDPNYSGGTFNYSCTTPLPTTGAGNISADPQLASASHLSAGSPCRGAGSAAYATGLDIDGEAWANPPSIGCDEFQPGAVTGPLSVAIVANYTTVATGFEVNFTAQITGRTSLSRWEFGDGTLATNRPYTPHSWTVAGDYPVVLWACNESYPDGVSATVTVHVVEQPVHYVAADSSNPVAPYGSWATAATNIQDAVDAPSVVGALVLVSDGVYQTGGRAVDGATTNRVAVTKPLTLRSVNGPGVTVITGLQVSGTVTGDNAVRCVYLTNGAALTGFTLTNGVADYGGGVLCAAASVVVSNCMLSGNSAYYYGGGAYQGTLNNCTLSGNVSFRGGGASRCTLDNCTLSGNSAYLGGGASGGRLNNCTLTANSASYDGGAVFYGTLNNCTLSDNSAAEGGGASESTLNNSTLTGNSANSGGGAFGGTLNNCVVYYNAAVLGVADYSYTTLNYCCTTPLPPGGSGNFTNAPLFVDQSGGNLRLQSNSPCINAGLNAYAPAGLDLDGQPRIVGGTVDVGAYEFQAPASLLSYAWLQQYGLPTDGSADYTDPDRDGLNNWQEWRAGTNPTNALSVLRLMTPGPGPSGVTVSWQSVDTRTYFLERSTNLGVAPFFLPLSNNIVGQAGTTTLLDTNAARVGPVFYRVGVQD